jgi:hypothetical protein
MRVHEPNNLKALLRAFREAFFVPTGSFDKVASEDDPAIVSLRNTVLRTPEYEIEIQ